MILFCRFFENDGVSPARLVFQEVRETPGAKEAQVASGGPEDPEGLANTTKAEGAQAIEAAQDVAEKLHSFPELYLDNFDQLITNNTKLVIVDVNADWCHPCHAFAAMFQELYPFLKDQVALVSLTTDRDKDKPDDQERQVGAILEKIEPEREIDSLPTLVYFKKGKREKSQEGPSGIELMNHLQSLGLKLKPEQYKQMILIIAKRQPGTILKTIDSIPKQHQKEALTVSIQNNPTYLFGQHEKYSQFPFFKELLKISVLGTVEIESYQIGLEQLSGPGTVLQYSFLFAKEPYAEEAINKAAVKEPSAACSYFKNYAQEPYAIEILKVVGEIAPDKLVPIFARNVEPHLPANQEQAAKAIFEQAVQNLADHNHKEFMSSASLIIQHHFSNGVENHGIRLMDQVIDQDPVAGLMFPNRYKDLPDAKERLQKALERTLAVDPAKIFEHYDSIFEYSDIALDPVKTLDTLRQAAIKAPEAGFQVYRLQRQHEKAVLQAAFDAAKKINPKLLFEYLDRYVGVLDALPVDLELKKHYQKFPESVLKHGKITQLSSGKAMFMQTIDSHPKEALLNWDPDLNNDPLLYQKLRGLVQRFLEQDPAVIIQASENGALPYDDKFFEEAFEKAVLKAGH